MRFRPDLCRSAASHGPRVVVVVVDWTNDIVTLLLGQLYGHSRAQERLGTHLVLKQRTALSGAEATGRWTSLQVRYKPPIPSRRSRGRISVAMGSLPREGREREGGGWGGVLCLLSGRARARWRGPVRVAVAVFRSWAYAVLPTSRSPGCRRAQSRPRLPGVAHYRPRPFRRRLRQLLLQVRLRLLSFDTESLERLLVLG